MQLFLSGFFFFFLRGGGFVAVLFVETWWERRPRLSFLSVLGVTFPDHLLK